jgi:uncharacterized protein YcnI
MTTSARAGTRPALRLVLALAVASGAVLATAGSADAHVTVGAEEKRRGAPQAELVFTVPSESRTASTVKITIRMPRETPLAFVVPLDRGGWTVTTRQVPFRAPVQGPQGAVARGVGEVVYTARSTTDGIPPGGDATFRIVVGPLPREAASLAFPTLQTYSDGTEVAWGEATTDPPAEPDHPAPVLALAAAVAPSAPGSPTATASASPSATASSAAPPSAAPPSAASPSTAPPSTAPPASAAALPPAVPVSAQGSGGGTALAVGLLGGALVAAGTVVAVRRVRAR